MTISTRTTIRLLSAAFSTASFFLRVPRDPCQHKHHVITFQLTFVFSPGPRAPPPAQTSTYFLTTDFCFFSWAQRPAARPNPKFFPFNWLWFFLLGPEARRPPKLQVLSFQLTFVFSPGPRGPLPTITPSYFPNFNFNFSSLGPRARRPLLLQVFSLILTLTFLPWAPGPAAHSYSMSFS